MYNFLLKITANFIFLAALTGANSTSAFYGYQPTLPAQLQ